MKKAKIVLSAVALFAVVGGALAFKTSRIASSLYHTTTTNTTTAKICATERYYNTQTLGTTVLAPVNSLYYNSSCTLTVPAVTIYRTTAPGL